MKKAMKAIPETHGYEGAVTGSPKIYSVLIVHHLDGAEEVLHGNRGPVI